MRRVDALLLSGSMEGSSTGTQSACQNVLPVTELLYLYRRGHKNAMYDDCLEWFVGSHSHLSFMVGTCTFTTN